MPRPIRQAVSSPSELSCLPSYAHHCSASRSTCAARTPSTSTTLLRPVAPATIRTARLATPNDCASRSTSASLAAPSTGGAESRTFSASPCTPHTSFREARGWTRTVKRTPVSRSLTVSAITRDPWNVLEASSPSRAPDHAEQEPLEYGQRKVGDDGRHVHHAEWRDHRAQRSEYRFGEREAPAHPPHEL